jgi:hypothetical protein
MKASDRSTFMKNLTDILTKIGGPLATIGMLVGGYLSGSTTCTSAFSGRSCSNAFGNVELDFAGQPHTAQLMIAGGLLGAAVGAAITGAVALLRPKTTP